MEARFPSKEKVAGSSPALGIYFEFNIQNKSIF